MKQRTLKEIIEWIMTNRKGAAFKDYSFEKIEQELYESMFWCCLLIAEDEQENIIGVVCGNRDINRKQVFVTDVLAIKQGVIKLFVSKCHERFPGFSINGIDDKGKPRIFKNTKQLMERL